MVNETKIQATPPYAASSALGNYSWDELQEFAAENMHRGYEPYETYPAKWHNSVLHQLTVTLEQIKVYCDSIQAELANVLAAAGKEPDPQVTNQLAQSIAKLAELPIATASVLGGVMSTAEDWGVSVDGTTGVMSVNTKDATTAQKGIVQLNSAVNSTSESQAATPKAVKSAYDKATSAQSAASDAASAASSASSEAQSAYDLASDVSSTASSAYSTAQSAASDAATALNKIDALDYAGADSSGTALQFITNVTQENGQISASKSQVQTFGGSGSGHKAGIVPDPGAAAGTSKFLCEDGTWKNIPLNIYGKMDTTNYTLQLQLAATSPGTGWVDMKNTGVKLWAICAKNAKYIVYDLKETSTETGIRAIRAKVLASAEGFVSGV